MKMEVTMLKAEENWHEKPRKMKVRCGVATGRNEKGKTKLGFLM